MPEHRRRLRVLLVATSLLVLGAIGAALHAGARLRADDEAADPRASLVRSLGHADLALSSSTRWIRHPSQVEPMAALQDAPGALDTDTGGAWVGPPAPRRNSP